jgi:hypothetical protein
VTGSGSEPGDLTGVETVMGPGGEAPLIDARLVVSALFADVLQEPHVIRLLEGAFGPVLAVSERLSFEQTDYYEAEMGADLRRRMLAFGDPFPPDHLVRAKLAAQVLEDRLRDSKGRRTVNLDPGILGLNNLVLATHKGYTHRIYLNQGVFADLALLFSQGRFRPLPWTYPDYASPGLLGFFARVREALLWQRRRCDGRGR